MTYAPRSRGVRAVLAALLLGTAFAPLAATSAQAAKPDDAGSVTVMTRNIYLGADINRPVRAATEAAEAGGDQAAILVALGRATHETREIVDRTNFAVRSRLLADEIADTAPDLVGLQEVALWRSGPLDLAGIAAPSATNVDYDFLEMLLDDLEEEGVSYEAVNVGMRADVEAPAFAAYPGDPTSRNVRMTMRDVILMRADAGLAAVGGGNKIYDVNLAVEIAGVPMNFDRGYNFVDVENAAGVDLRFVNTHLEAFSSDIALAQAVQMVTEAGATPRTTVIACDCNSDPLDDSVKSFDAVAHKAPYEFIVGQGFEDMWLVRWPAQRGWTAGLSELVNDTRAWGFDHRIDMIFARTAAGETIRVRHGEVTGDKKGDRDKATGLWPSDHAGVVIKLEGLAD
ncbi:MAG TPA: endonuclease/exonuclease/phosphatase family protein [Nocardioidaceae bacterium]|nr:endonuclease/exonuclease/phosphatase family protein [Nocardioidaceae bacterium]